MGLTSKTSLLNLDKVGPWGPAIRIKHGGNTDEVLGAWGPRYFVGGTGNLVYVKTAANTWSEVSNVYLKTAADTWSAVRQFCVKEDASTWDGTGDEMSGSDLVFPVFQSAATNTNGTKVILTYNKTLSATTAATSAFAVVADGSSSTVSSVATSGATVELTMQSGIHPGETVTVAYTDPSGSDDANAIQNVAGLDAISLSATSVTNNVVSAAFQSAATNTSGSKVILTYNQTLSSTTAAASAFVVTDGGSAVTVSSVAVSGSTVELTMQSPITVGAAITVAYTDPSGSDDANAIQGTTGVDVASLSATSVTNNAVAPVFQSAATNNDGTKVILTYNQALSSTTAATSAFAVVVNSSAATVSSAAVSGSTVELTMGTAITSGQTATVAYTDPSGSDDANAVQGAGGIDVASFTATSITVSAGGLVYDFTTGSIPSGWAINSSARPTGSKFTDSTDGDYYLIKGNCNDQLGFPLRNTTAFQGDNLFQLSFYASDVDCRDWGVAVTEHTYTSTTADDWYWKWNVTTNVLSAKCNCSNPTLYGFTSKQETGGSVGNDQTAQWYTMHFMVYTSTASTKLKITQGQSDWDASGTQVGATKSVSDRIVGNSTTDYWFGIGADNDETSYAKASGCRISQDSSDFF